MYWYKPIQRDQSNCYATGGETAKTENLCHLAHGQAQRPLPFIVEHGNVHWYYDHRTDDIIYGETGNN